MSNLTSLVAQAEDEDGGLTLMENEDTSAHSLEDASNMEEDIEDGEGDEMEKAIKRVGELEGDYGDEGEEDLFEKDEDHSDVEEHASL